MDQGKKCQREENPRESASIFTVISFLFTYKIFRKGVKRELDNADVYEVRSKFESNVLANRLEDYWLTEKKANNENASLLKVLIKCYGPYYLGLGLIQLFMRTGMALLQPKALGKFVAYFAPGQTTISTSDCYFYAFLVIALTMVNTIYNHNYMQVVQELGLTIRTATCSLIYRKTLRLSPAGQSQMPMGQIVTLITKDVFTYDSALVFLNDIWVGLIQTAIISYLIFNKIGLSVFSGMGFFFAIIPIQVLIGKYTGVLRYRSYKQTDKRLQLVQEVLAAIKIIKMYTWERYFGNKINDIRKSETNLLKKIYYLKFTVLIIGGLASQVAFYLLIMTYIWTGHFIDAEIVYFVQNCFYTLRSYMTASIPLGITQTADMLAATSRIQKFLKLEEMKTNVPKWYPEPNPKIFMENVCTKTGDVEILKNVSLSVEKGFMVLTGNVGSGKSSVLKTILGECSVSSGKIEVSGSISYVPQEPWLFPSSIRQNIIFGETYIEKRYRDVLTVCALNYDLNQFEHGDNAIVTDKGVNLSKGQQARICLARAIYKDSDIYLLDDCLTALDSRVSQYVFKECILEFLKNKICILVTHNMNHIKQVSGNVLFIEKGTTLSLEQQKERLDKRITYFIDDGESYDMSGDLDEMDDNENTDEHIELLQNKENDVSKNLYYEKNQAGKVTWDVYMRYYKFAGGILVVLTLFVLFLTCQSLWVFSDKIVSVWVNIEPNITKLIKKNLTNTTEYKATIETRGRVLNIYTLSIIGGTLLAVARTIFNFHFCLKASKRMHNALTDAVLNTYMSFFDSHLIGNIVNRFSKDFTTIDEILPHLIYENLRTTMMVTGIIILIVSVNPKFIILSAALLACLFVIRKYYIPTGRAVKRLEASTRSPMVGYINASVEGLSVIRAYGNQQTLISEFDKHQDLYTSAFYMLLCSSRAFSFFMDMLCTFFLAAIVLKFTIFPSENAGNVGLAVSQALALSGMLQWAIKNLSELENNMTAVERITEYTDIKKEDGESGQVIPNWPNEGSISYKDVNLIYRTSNEQVLKSISFDIKGKSKIGIVGRTGAGKSSIISTLFRLYEVEGTILVDQEDTKRMSLKLLRSNIAIIPQDPVLFSGSIRDNIDPLGNYDDSAIWEAIEKVNMKHVIADLSQPVKDKGSNLSCGQRQLLCLARALISKNKIVVLDEATSNMDPETDDMLQKSIKANFSDCTVVTIAHRLHTIINSEKVMVVDGGKIVQYDTPTALLQDKDKAFYKMVKQSGIAI